MRTGIVAQKNRGNNEPDSSALRDGPASLVETFRNRDPIVFPQPENRGGVAGWQSEMLLDAAAHA